VVDEGPRRVLDASPVRPFESSHSLEAHNLTLPIPEDEEHNLPRVERLLSEVEREFIIDNLLVRIHLIIEMILVDRPRAMGVLSEVAYRLIRCLRTLVVAYAASASLIARDQALSRSKIDKFVPTYECTDDATSASLRVY